MSPRRRLRGNPGGIYPNNAYRGGHFKLRTRLRKSYKRRRSRLERSFVHPSFFLRQTRFDSRSGGIRIALSSYDRSTIRMP